MKEKFFLFWADIRHNADFAAFKGRICYRAPGFEPERKELCPFGRTAADKKSREGPESIPGLKLRQCFMTLNDQLPADGPAAD